jgi:hypothetical protein
VYGGSLGLHTTVNMGVRFLKPGPSLVTWSQHGKEQLTSDWKLRAASDELQELPTLLGSVFTHSLEQVPHALAVEVEPVIRLDGIHESCVMVSYMLKRPLSTTYSQGTSPRLSCQTASQARQA